ncbi:hypothetical protein MRX96_052681 [Rhipicephalus microplus]
MAESADRKFRREINRRVNASFQLIDSEADVINDTRYVDRDSRNAERESDLPSEACAVDLEDGHRRLCVHDRERPSAHSSIVPETDVPQGHVLISGDACYPSGCSVSVPHDHTDFERRAFHDSSAAASTSATSQGHAGLNVLVIQANWRMNPKHKAILNATAVVCVVSFVLYLGASMWIRVIDRGVFRAFYKRAPHADHADLPLFSGCAEVACHKYMAAIELSINRSQDPCQNLYRFVCDRWKDPNRLLSVVDAAETAMYGRAHSAIEWRSEDVSGLLSVGKSAFGVANKVAGLVKSCKEISQSSLPELKRFMAERHLPWPMTSRWDLFGDIAGPVWQLEFASVVPRELRAGSLSWWNRGARTQNWPQRCLPYLDHHHADVRRPTSSRNSFLAVQEVCANHAGHIRCYRNGPR